MNQGDFQDDTLRCPPPEGCNETPSVYDRIMGLPPDAGTRRLTTWQKSHERDKAFNARGCR